MLEDFSHENEEDNDASSEGFTNGEGGCDGDGHGQLHRHAAFQESAERLPVDWVAADDSGRQRNDVYLRERSPKMKNARQSSEGDKANSNQLGFVDAVRALDIGRLRFRSHLKFILSLRRI